jgi:hypothetical protein
MTSCKWKNSRIPSYHVLILSVTSKSMVSCMVDPSCDEVVILKLGVGYFQIFYAFDLQRVQFGHETFFIFSRYKSILGKTVLPVTLDLHDDHTVWSCRIRPTWRYKSHASTGTIRLIRYYLDDYTVTLATGLNPVAPIVPGFFPCLQMVDTQDINLFQDVNSENLGRFDMIECVKDTKNRWDLKNFKGLKKDKIFQRLVW